MEESNKRLAKNAIFLYIRTLILMIIGLFTSRITLQALGIDNYGIVNVVSGFVAMFALISGSLTGTCQRFITYELGLEKPNVREVFSTSLHIHLWLGFVIIVLAETVGLYFVNYKLNLPGDQMIAVQWVYQCSIISFIISLINIPYNAIIIAHERMAVFAYISLLEGFLKLLVVVALLYIDGNKLIIYALLGLLSSILVRATFQFYCRRTFKDQIKIKRRIDVSYSKKIFGFAGWTIFGSSATILSNQGVNIVLNIFCGVAVNAARGIAVMVENIITNFVNNFTTALNPQITKAYACGDHTKLEYLIINGMSISFYLMMILALPVAIAAPNVLNIWFVSVPEYAPVFVQFTLANALIIAMGNPFLTALMASGKIMKYQVVVGLFTLCNLPGSYLLLKFGASPISVYLLLIIVSTVSFVIRILYLKYYVGLKLKSFIQPFTKRLLPIAILSCLLSYTYLTLFKPATIWYLIIYGMCAVLSIGALTFYMGLSDKDRKRVFNYFTNKIVFR